MAMRLYKGKAELSGLRLDKALAQLEPQYSRTVVKKFIEKGYIKLGENIETDPAAAYSGQDIELTLPEINNKPSAELIYQDDNILVLNKPSGMLTHAKGNYSEEWTLADQVAPLVEDSGNRPGIVHRLDRDTSGVIIVARHPRAKKYLQKQFQNRSVGKQYVALVSGRIEPDEVELDWPLGRNPKQPSMWMVDLAGKPANTGLKVIKRWPDATLVELSPKTGRTHQLRVHMAHYGHPILGDRLYAQPNNYRLMLHAQLLQLNIPYGIPKTFEAPWPKDFTDIVESYGSD